MRHTSQAEALAWEVELPGKRSSLSWGAKPKGALLIGSDPADAERIPIPVAVARILTSKKKAGEIHPLSRAELLYMVGEVSKACARSRIERLIDRREYASDEVRHKLHEDGYAASTIDACVSRAQEAGLISDQRFADSFIRSKVFAGWGMMRIARELSSRGIDVSQVDGWPYEYLDPDDETQRAYEVASSRRVSGTRAYEKLVRYLMGRGFSSGVAHRAAHRIIEEQDDGDLVDF